MLKKTKRNPLNKAGNLKTAVIKKYMKNPTQCPFCDSADSLDRGPVLGLTRVTECMACSNSWEEEYEMTSMNVRK
jgi:hypothetical protein